MDIQTANANTNTNTFNQIGIINSDKTKKKPHNITIKNFNPNEPKIRKSKLLYTDKQKYRTYKTKIEPKLYSKIMVDEEEDLIAKIRKEFGIEDKTIKNYSSPETSGTPYYEEPKQQNLMDDFTDMTNNEIEDIIGELKTSVENQFKRDVADKVPLPLSDDDEEEEDEDISIFDDDAFEVPDDDEEPAALTREASRGTVLSTATTAAIPPEDLEDMALRYGIVFPGRPPTTKKGIEKRNKLIRQEIARKDKERGAAP